MLHLGSSIQVEVDEWQVISSGKEELDKWLANLEEFKFLEQITSTLFKGTYKGKKVALRKLRGCEKNISYKVEFRRDILELMTCGHKNILSFYGICVDVTHGMCTITKFMEGGSLDEKIQRSKKLPLRYVPHIAIDTTEGIFFLIDHVIVHRDLNTMSTFLDKQAGKANIADIGLIHPCQILGEVLEYEIDGHKLLAPKVFQSIL